MLRLPPISTLFPYTTLFRSEVAEVMSCALRMLEAMEWWPLFIGGAGGDAMCATLYAGGAGGDAPCALCMLEVAEVMLHVLCVWWRWRGQCAMCSLYGGGRWGSVWFIGGAEGVVGGAACALCVLLVVESGLCLLDVL